MSTHNHSQRISTPLAVEIIALRECFSFEMTLLNSRNRPVDAKHGKSRPFVIRRIPPRIAQDIVLGLFRVIVDIVLLADIGYY